ncbi:MAG: ROK family protein [Gaiellaceae bacterium]
MAEPLVIGVDVGGTNIRTAQVDRSGAIARRVERPTPVGSEAALLEGLEAAVSDALSPEVLALGFGIPSTIDRRTGRAVSSVNVPLTDLDLASHMTARFGLPAGIDNDAHAATLAEWTFGAGRGTRHMVLLTLGTGIGGGLILDGRPYRGAVGAGGELGHIVIEHDGPPCPGSCSGRGHLEALASGTAADAESRRLLGDGSTAADLVAAAREGDEAAGTALAELGRRLGSGIGTLVNIFNPELVVLAGGFAEAGELLFEPAREIVRREALQPARDFVRIVPAELGPEAGVVGAALLAFEALERR